MARNKIDEIAKLRKVVEQVGMVKTVWYFNTDHLLVEEREVCREDVCIGDDPRSHHIRQRKLEGNKLFRSCRNVNQKMSFLTRNTFSRTNNCWEIRDSTRKKWPTSQIPLKVMWSFVYFSSLHTSNGDNTTYQKRKKGSTVVKYIFARSIFRLYWVTKHNVKTLCVVIVVLSYILVVRAWFCLSVMWSHINWRWSYISANSSGDARQVAAGHELQNIKI